MERHKKSLKLGARFSILAGALLCVSTAFVIPQAVHGHAEGRVCAGNESAEL